MCSCFTGLLLLRSCGKGQSFWWRRCTTCRCPNRPLLSSSAKFWKLQVLSKEKKPTHQTRYWVRCPSTTTNIYRKDSKRAGKGRNAGLETAHLEPCQWYVFFSFKYYYSTNAYLQLRVPYDQHHHDASNLHHHYLSNSCRPLTMTTIKY